MKRDAVRDLLEGSQTAPDGHQEEEAQIDHGSDLAHEVEGWIRRLRTQITQHQEVDDEYSVQVLVRSEEHTSELQSLMRISYAVFCLPTKNNNKQKQQNKSH